MTAPVRRSGSRPLGIWLLAAALLGNAAASGLFFAGIDPWPGEPLVIQALLDTNVGSASIALSGVLSLIAAIGLVLRLRWAWVLTMLLVGIGLATDLVFVLEGESVRIRLLTEAVMALYLNQRALREVFDPPPVPPDTSPGASLKSQPPWASREPRGVR